MLLVGVKVTTSSAALREFDVPAASSARTSNSRSVSGWTRPGTPCGASLGDRQGVVFAAREMASFAAGCGQSNGRPATTPRPRFLIVHGSATRRSLSVWCSESLTATFSTSSARATELGP
jgi:hypothetical protein